MKKYYNVIDSKAESTNQIVNYVRDNFNISRTSYLLIDSITTHLEQNNISYESYRNGFMDEEIYIPSYLRDLIHILNSADIDINVDELLRENILVADE